MVLIGQKMLQSEMHSIARQNDVRTKYETFCPDISIFRFIWKREWHDVDT